MLKKEMQSWVKALRSGKYNQGTGALRMSVWDDQNDEYKDKYCCLGVRADQLSKRKTPVCTRDIEQLTYDGEYSYLPRSVVAHDKFKAARPSFKYEATLPSGQVVLEQYSLTVLNDNDVPFDQMADLIERFYDQL